MNTILARWFTAVGPSRPKNKIVLHSMQAPNKPDTAEGVGQFFSRLPPGSKASAHVGADVNSRVRYVSDDDVAYAAPGANHDGLHIELAGYAEYDAGRWTQPDMMAMLQQASAQMREWSQRYDIPLRFLRAGELARDPNIKGVTTHNEVRLAYRLTNHWDPGPGFPINTALAMSATPATAAVQEVDEMAAYLHCECPTGGYWLVKPSDGGVFAYEGAPFPDRGSLPAQGIKPTVPIVDMAPCVRDGAVVGYWMLGADGGVFSFGQAPFTDSYAGHPEWKMGEREFVGIQQNGDGYTLLAVEARSDPPRVNAYDLSVKR